MNIELLKPHTHAGVRYAPGAHLDIDEATARWLIDHAVAQEVAVADAAPKLAIPVRKGD